MGNIIESLKAGARDHASEVFPTVYKYLGPKEIILALVAHMASEQALGKDDEGYEEAKELLMKANSKIPYRT